MRKGLAISAVVHAMVLLWSLITFAPKAFQTPTDSVPVDIISATDFSRMVAGKREAPKAPAPKPRGQQAGRAKPHKHPPAQEREKDGGHKTRRETGAAAGSQARAEARSRAQADAAQGRSDRRSLEEGTNKTRAEEGRG